MNENIMDTYYFVVIGGRAGRGHGYNVLGHPAKNYENSNISYITTDFISAALRGSESSMIAIYDEDGTYIDCLYNNCSELFDDSIYISDSFKEKYKDIISTCKKRINMENKLRRGSSVAMTYRKALPRVKVNVGCEVDGYLANVDSSRGYAYPRTLSETKLVIRWGWLVFFIYSEWLFANTFTYILLRVVYLNRSE